MTLLFDARAAGMPGTHVLAIGVGRYPHLLGGDGRPARNPMGLGQLNSPPVSLCALLTWLFTMPGEGPGFCNQAAPLASVEALCSAAMPVTVNTPALGAVPLAPATRDNIQDAFEAWLERLRTNPGNVGVFYFCGHGVAVADHYLLAEDFGRTAQPWTDAFNISLTIRAIEREITGSVFFFIDACRTIARALALSLGVDPAALIPVDLTKRLSRQHVTAIYATGDGQSAFAPVGGQVSYFTAALLRALSGYCGTKAPGEHTWNVDGDNVASAIRTLLEHDDATLNFRAGRDRQVSDQYVAGSMVPLLRLATPPKVMVCLDLAPRERRSRYELYLEKGARRVTQARLDQVFKVDLPRGIYEVGAHDPQGALPHVVHEDEDLVPPMYTLTLRSSP